MASFVDRIMGAAKLNVATYEEVEADTGATGQAITVVALASLAVGIAQALGWLTIAGPVSAVVAFVGYTVLAVAGWLVWTIVTLIVGTKMLPEPETKSDMGELMRTVGFAQAPGILRVVTIIPIVGWLVGLAVWVWMLAAFVIAARQALDYKSTGRAIAVVLIGGAVYGLILVFVVGMIMAAVIGAGIAAGGASN